MPWVLHPFWRVFDPRGGAMFADEIRQAVEAAPRVKLPEVSAVLWRAFGAGQVSEAEAEALSGLIEARRALPATPKPASRHAGSRPRSPASLERRRSWAASGRLPPSIAARFTPGEAAVLAVLAVEVRRSGDCRWPNAKLAAIAGVSVSTVKRALRQAQALDFASVEERRVSASRSDTNVIRILSPEWRMWLRLGGGGQTGTPKTTSCSGKGFAASDRPSAKAWREKVRAAFKVLERPSGTLHRPEGGTRGRQGRGSS